MTRPRPTPPRGRRASILLLVLILAVLLLTFSLALWRSNETQESQNVVNLTRVQAEYLARGAIQLALLKSRLLGQPLYDASDYSIGKNPAYPHFVGTDHLTGARTGFPSVVGAAAFAPGPAFFTPRDNLRDANLDGTADDADGAMMDAYLARFRADLASAEPSGLTRATTPPMDPTTWEGVEFPGIPWTPQGAIQVDSSAADGALGLPADPYDGFFEIVDMRVLGGRDNQIHTEEALLIVARARIQNLTKGETQTWTSTVRRIYKMRRNLAAP